MEKEGGDRRVVANRVGLIQVGSGPVMCTDPGPDRSIEAGPNLDMRYRLAPVINSVRRSQFQPLIHPIPSILNDLD